MKKIQLFLFTAAAMAAVSCGSSITLPAESVALNGEHSKYIAMVDNEVTVEFVETQSGDALAPTMDVTFKLVEKPEPIKDYLLEYNSISIALCNEAGENVELDLLYADSVNCEKFKSLLGGYVDDKVTVTFCAENGRSKDAIEKLKQEIVSFSIDKVTFAKDGRKWDDYISGMEAAIKQLIPISRQLKYDSGNLSLIYKCSQYAGIVDSANKSLLKAEKNNELSRKQIARFHKVVEEAAALMN